MSQRYTMFIVIFSVVAVASLQLSAQTVQELMGQCKQGPMGSKERELFMSAQNNERSRLNMEYSRRQKDLQRLKLSSWDNQMAFERLFNEFRDKTKALQARQQDEWDKAVISCSLKQDFETFHKGFDTQKEELRKKLETVHQKLEKISPEDKAFGIRQFSAQEWKSLIDALQVGYTKKGHNTIDAYIFAIPIHNYEKLDANWKSTASFVSNASNVQKFVDYLVSLKDLPENQRFGLTPDSIGFIQKIFNEKSQETTGNECVGLEILFGPDFNQLTIAEQAYVDQLGCRTSGYFKGS